MTTSPATVPAVDLVAEETVLVGLFSYPEVYDEMAEMLSPGDFHSPMHQQFFAVLETACRASERPTRSLLTDSGVPPHVQDQLFRSGFDPMRHEAKAAARTVSVLALRRRILNFAAKAQQQSLSYDADPAETAAWIRAEAAILDVPLGVREPTPGFVEFMATSEDPLEWVVPGILAAGERLLLTGGEGHGKSTLLRQIAFCTAVGVHPFGGYSTHSAPVLVIDVENTRSQVQQGYRPMRAAARSRGLVDPDDYLRIECRTEGLDLGNRADATWFAETVAANKPALVITGPLYKLHTGDPNDEKPARTIASAIDRVRSRFNVAVIVETHSPYGDSAGRRPGRPYGSSLWARWPEFGLTLRPDAQDGCERMHVEHWRGPRSERTWPKVIRRGGAWPWTVVE